MEYIACFSLMNTGARPSSRQQSNFNDVSSNFSEMNFDDSNRRLSSKRSSSNTNTVTSAAAAASHRQPPLQQHQQQQQQQSQYSDSYNDAAHDDSNDDNVDAEQLQDQQLHKCNDCGRSFNEQALARHAGICKKVFVQKRKAFDAAKVRNSVALIIYTVSFY
jgi:hypothetical protein